MRNMKHDSKHFLTLELLLLPNDRRLGFVSSMEVGQPCPYLGYPWNLREWQDNCAIHAMNGRLLD